jgi:hypothetical protein
MKLNDLIYGKIDKIDKTQFSIDAKSMSNKELELKYKISFASITRLKSQLKSTIQEIKEESKDLTTSS